MTRTTITAEDISSGAIEVADIADDAVHTAKIADDAVTPAKINIFDAAASASTSGHILVSDGTDFGNAAVSGDATISSSGVLTIANDAVTTAKIADDQITSAKLDTNITLDGDLTAQHLNSTGGGVEGGQLILRAVDGTSTGLLLDINSADHVRVYNAQNTDIIFHTNAAERMRINSSGNVGIGTTSPTEKLQVAGTISSTNGITEHHTNTGFQYKESASEHIAQYKKTSNTYSYYWRTSDNGELDGANGKTIAEWRNDRLRFFTDNTERMHIDSSGRVTMPYQPAFYAYSDANFTRVNDAILNPTWTVAINEGNGFSSANDRYTAPVAGTYLICYRVGHSGGSTSIGDAWTVIIRKNGSNIYGGQELWYGNGGVESGKESQHVGTIIADLNVNDYVQLYTSGSTQTITIQAVQFGGYLLG